MNDKTCIIVTGPTAVGKTSLAIHLAECFNTAIISADSRQCYKELNIGVAKPSPEQLIRVPHYFISSHSVVEEVNASVFEAYALEAASRMFEQHNTVVMAGGTGLYLKAFCEGLDAVPATNSVVRERIIREYEEKGIEWLQQQVSDKDPVFYASGEIKNPHRLMRALEVILVTGKSLLNFHNRQKKTRPFQIIRIGIELPKEELYRNIDTRVDEMIGQGLLKEVNDLLPYREFNALNTVGYKEVFEYLDGKRTLKGATEAIKINTRHYAKRQLTWFKKDSGIHWFHPSQREKILMQIRSMKDFNVSDNT